MVFIMGALGTRDRPDHLDLTFPCGSHEEGGHTDRHSASPMSQNSGALGVRSVNNSQRKGH